MIILSAGRGSPLRGRSPMSLRFRSQGGYLATGEGLGEFDGDFLYEGGFYYEEQNGIFQGFW